MSLCASCGLQLSGDAALCPHHHCVYGEDWAVANRILCDGLHRKRWAPRLSAAEREEWPGQSTAPSESGEWAE